CAGRDEGRLLRAAGLVVELVERETVGLLSLEARVGVGARARARHEHVHEPREDDAERRADDQQLDERVAALVAEPGHGCEAKRRPSGSGAADDSGGSGGSGGSAAACQEGSASGSGRDAPCACSLSDRSSATRKSWRLPAALAAVSRSTSPRTTRSISARSNVCMPKYSPSAIASTISSERLSRIRSATRALVTITSTAATRPPPARGSNRCETTPRSTPAMIERICCCFCAGKNSIIRPTVSAASMVCMVEKTRWPD